MQVYLCEKPSQAKDLAAVLNVTKRGDGYLYDGENIGVTWAFGHLLEMFMPQDYDDRYKSWSLEQLPISPNEWKSRVQNSKLKQYNVIANMLKKASVVYIATDFDREGEAIARSIMAEARYSGPVKRVCLRALDETNIRKALQDIREGSETMPMYYAALARQRADWLIGMNISRLYTTLARGTGFNQTLHIGRVITPTVALVCDRDNQIKDFKASPYWDMSVAVSVQNGQFKASWVPPEQCVDESGKCINKPFAEQVAAQVQGCSGQISKSVNKEGKESAPLPFNLSALQQYASKRWGYTAQQTLGGAQALYETHKATSYPRTDSRYLPESQRSDVPAILQALMLSDPAVSGIVAGADHTRSSRAFNDAKVTAHHGIVPTSAKVNPASMSELERNLYDAVRRFYIAQFYSDFEFLSKSIEVIVNSHAFTAHSKEPLRQGWKVLFGSDEESEPTEKEEKDPQKSTAVLPRVNQGEPAIITESKLDDKMTRAPAHFTEATLLSAMENIARFVSEEKFKKILKETAGIGTQATRAGIIQGAVDKGYFTRKKNTLIATDKAQALIAVLPAAIKSPGMTAAWEQELEKIEAGTSNINDFMGRIAQWVCNLVNQLKENSAILTEPDGLISNAFKNAIPPVVECFNCGGELRRIKGKNGFFWGCRNAPCSKTFDDNRGRPVDPDKVKKTPKNAPACPECSAVMMKRKSKANKGESVAISAFWGCPNYPTCKATVSIPKRKSSGQRNTNTGEG